MAGAFVLSVGRSGSTMISRLMQRHPGLLSISEYWTCLWMRSFGDPILPGADYWRLLAEPPYWYTNFIRKAAAAGEVPEEIIYRGGDDGFALERCPPILTMTLPALSDHPNELYQRLRAVVPTWRDSKISAHSARLFTLLAGWHRKDLWIERSGLSYWYVPDLVSGFPDARYIHLTRDGREVLLSMVGMRLFDPIVRAQWLLSIFKGGRFRRKLFFAERNRARRVLLAATRVERAVTRQHARARPYSLPDRLGEAERIKAYALFWAASCELGLEAIAAIPKERILTVRYEDLVATPRATLEAMIDFVAPGGDHAAWLDQVSGVPSRRPGRWNALDRGLAEEVEAIIEPMNRRLGYA